MGLSDLHIHSIYSHDGTARVPAIVERAAQVGLDVIAIADHDAMGGVLQALQVGPIYGVDVIPACEISTLDGHLVALFIHSPIPPWLTLAETLRRVGDQGGICYAAHPGGHYDYSLMIELVRRTLENPELARVLVGVESFNAGLLHGNDNQRAQALARELPISRVGGSDAHILRSIGTGMTWFSGTSADDLRLALETRGTEAIPGRTRALPLVLAEWGVRLAWRRLRQLAGADYPESHFVGRHPGRDLPWLAAAAEVPTRPLPPERDAHTPAGDD